MKNKKLQIFAVISIVIGSTLYLSKISHLIYKDFIVDSKNPTFREVYSKHQDNLSDKWDNYLEIYQIHFQKFIGNSPTFLEIGVQNGGSLQIADKYFVNGNIYGVDINPEVCKMNLGKNIKTHCFNISEKEKVEQNIGTTSFNIILDDGSHQAVDIIQPLKRCFQN